MAKNQHGRHAEWELSPDKAQSIEFTSGQSDDFVCFKEEAKAVGRRTDLFIYRRRILQL